MINKLNLKCGIDYEKEDETVNEMNVSSFTINLKEARNIKVEGFDNEANGICDFKIGVNSCLYVSNIAFNLENTLI